MPTGHIILGVLGVPAIVVGCIALAKKYLEVNWDVPENTPMHLVGVKKAFKEVYHSEFIFAVGLTAVAAWEIAVLVHARIYTDAFSGSSAASFPLIIAMISLMFVVGAFLSVVFYRRSQPILTCQRN